MNYVLNSFSIAKRISQLLSIGAQPNLNLEQVGKFHISYPSLEEQVKISNFLSSVDSKIEQIEKQLDETKQFKKALLQQMFV